MYFDLRAEADWTEARESATVRSADQSKRRWLFWNAKRRLRMRNCPR
jgi:hypothetical protein